MAAAGRAPEIAWPSLSDLSGALGSKRRQLDTLGREVRRLKLRTAKVGRERRVEPEAAVKLLQKRGLPASTARAWVMRVVRRRIREVPAIGEPTEADTTTTSASAYGDPLVEAAAQRYDAVHEVVLPLPQGRADFSTEQLMEALRGGAR